MKDLLKSKAMMLFLVFMIGVFFLNALDIQKMETKEKEENIYAYLNV